MSNNFTITYHDLYALSLNRLEHYKDLEGEACANETLRKHFECFWSDVRIWAASNVGMTTLDDMREAGLTQSASVLLDLYSTNGALRARYFDQPMPTLEQDPSNPYLRGIDDALRKTRFDLRLHAFSNLIPGLTQDQNDRIAAAAYRTALGVITGVQNSYAEPPKHPQSSGDNSSTPTGGLAGG